MADLDGADHLLQRAVRDGNVDYNEALAGRDLDDALDVIARADLDAMDDDGRYVFLINAYNICTLDAVRRVLVRPGKPRRSLRNPFRWLRFFLLTRVTVAGRRTSLAGLEFRRIKRYLAVDPRGHFALVCASAGCPPLRGGVFHGDALDEELDLAARAFMRPGAGYELRDDALWLNRIFKWYCKDFEAMGGPRAVWERYAPADDVERARGKRIRYLRYDWSLNAA